jgi:hypothetical protein
MKRAILGCACLMVSMAGCAFFCTPMGPRPGEDQYLRAGRPREVSHVAHPSDTGKYIGYKVGGGAASEHKGEPPAPDEGTFGWDYGGYCIPSKVDLLWHHGRYQGGVGSYRTDGPAPVKKFHELRESRGEHHGEGHGGEGHGGEGHGGGHGGNGHGGNGKGGGHE